MPVVNVSLTGPVVVATGDPAQVFADTAGIDCNLVTVNVIGNVVQFGNCYRATAHIVIPEAWERVSRERFLSAAAELLASCYGIGVADSLVYLTTVAPAMALDRGKLE